MNDNNNSNNNKKLEKTIFEFIKNRAHQNESTTSRHIHRRFDIPIEQAQVVLTSLLKKQLIEEFYDTEYQENRYTSKSQN